MLISELKDPKDRAYAERVSNTDSMNRGVQGRGPYIKPQIGLTPLERFVCAIYKIDVSNPFGLRSLVDSLMNQESKNLFDYHETLRIRKQLDNQNDWDNLPTDKEIEKIAHASSIEQASVTAMSPTEP